MKEIELYNAIDKITTRILVEQMDSDKFRMVNNDFVNGLTKGTEFEIKVNTQGVYELSKITKESEYVTSQYFLSTKHKESDYLMLAEELTKHGGYWQLDFGGIAIINVPKDIKFDIDQVLKELNLELTEMFEDEIKK